VRRTVLAVSGSRADYGLLLWPMRALAAAPDFTLRVAVTGQHLDPAFGSTLDAFAADGLPVDERVPIPLDDDSEAGIARAVARGIEGFAAILAARRPDLVMVLGDRFEILAAAQAAFLARLPIAHWCGGDVTAGAQDEAFRHAISKMAHLHLATSDDAARRLARMGEDPSRIVVAGSPGLDTIRLRALPDRAAVERALGIALRRRNLVVAFHPVTLEPGRSLAHQAEMLAALDSLGSEIGIVATAPNADAEGRALRAALEDWVAMRPHAAFAVSLGSPAFLALVRLADAIVGNSSAGLYEAPALGTPTVNVGSRQEGRLRAASVIDCPPRRAAIRAAIDRALELDMTGIVSPYGDGHASERMLAALRAVPDFASLLMKRFHDG